MKGYRAEMWEMNEIITMWRKRFEHNEDNDETCIKLNDNDASCTNHNS